MDDQVTTDYTMGLMLQRRGYAKLRDSIKGYAEIDMTYRVSQEVIAEMSPLQQESLNLILQALSEQAKDEFLKAMARSIDLINTVFDLPKRG